MPPKRSEAWLFDVTSAVLHGDGLAAWVPCCKGGHVLIAAFIGIRAAEQIIRSHFWGIPLAPEHRNSPHLWDRSSHNRRSKDFMFMSDPVETEFTFRTIFRK
jgi:hypothetical protein